MVVRRGSAARPEIRLTHFSLLKDDPCGEATAAVQSVPMTIDPLKPQDPSAIDADQPHASDMTVDLTLDGLDGLDDLQDDLSEKIERLIEGRMGLVSRSDCRESVSRLHRKIDILEAGEAELRNRISRLEGKLSQPLMGKEGK